MVQFITELSSAMVNLRNETRTQFFKDVHIIANREGIYLVPISYTNEDIDFEINPENIWENPYRGFILKNVIKKTENPEENIYLIIEHDWDNLYYGLVGIKNNEGKLTPFFYSDSQQANNLYGLIYSKTSSLNKINRKYNNFFAWGNFYPDGKTHFLSDNLNYLFLKEGEKIADDFVKEIQTYLSSLKED